MPLTTNQVIPIFRIFDVDKAKEFYIGYLGFTIDWEHYGDGSPGSTVFVTVTRLDQYHKELSSKNYRYLRPGICNEPWGARSMNVIDPFGNRIRFNEYVGS
jgi:hypothetical protein